MHNNAAAAAGSTPTDATAARSRSLLGFAAYSHASVRCLCESVAVDKMLRVVTGGHACIATTPTTPTLQRAHIASCVCSVVAGVSAACGSSGAGSVGCAQWGVVEQPLCVCLHAPDAQQSAGRMRVKSGTNIAKNPNRQPPGATPSLNNSGRTDVHAFLLATKNQSFKFETVLPTPPPPATP